MMDLLRRFRPAEQPVTYHHNRVLLFPGGGSLFRALHGAIRAAEHYVLVEFYTIHSDATGTALAAELVDAVRRGVRVFLIYDYIGSIETPSSFFADLTLRGVNLVPFNVPSLKRGLHWFDRRDHRKMVIADGALAFLGGFNIGDEYSGLSPNLRHFRDVGLSISGSAVSELVRNFSESWKIERRELPDLPAAGEKKEPSARHRGRADVVIVSGSPHQRHSYIRNAFLLNMAAATNEILIATPYFVPGPRMLRSLMRAARRGVKVRLLLPGRSDVPLVLLVGRSYYGALLREGVEIRELERDILHAKVMLIDGERTLIGSANLDQRSFHRNYEINSVIDDVRFGKQIKRMFLRDFLASRLITRESHEQRGFITRIIEKLINLFGWFL
jgi:cardiolipin synthase A/B